MNVLLLWDAALTRGYRSNAWLTFRQALGLGGHVKKGEHGCSIVYASSFTKRETDEASGEERDRKVPFLKSYSVFNIEQTEGLPETMYAVVEPKPLEDAIAGVEEFLDRIGADVRYGGDRACYAPAYDVIRLPDPGTFESAAHLYATSLHEHAHWSGAKHRLDRDLTGRFGDEAYAAEELVAELTGVGDALQDSDPFPTDTLLRAVYLLKGWRVYLCKCAPLSLGRARAPRRFLIT